MQQVPNRAKPEGHGSTVQGHLNQSKGTRKASGGKFPQTEFVLKNIAGRGKSIAKRSDRVSVRPFLK